MSTKRKPTPKPLTSTQRQRRRYGQLQAAAERDGWTNWSEALTAWKKGKARLVKVEA